MAESQAPPNRGDKFRGPDGEVEVVSVDFAVEGVVLVKPAGAGSNVEPTKVSLAEWRGRYVYVHPDAATGEVADAARRGFEDRGTARPPVTPVTNPARVAGQ